MSHRHPARSLTASLLALVLVAAPHRVWADDLPASAAASPVEEATRADRGEAAPDLPAHAPSPCRLDLVGGVAAIGAPGEIGLAFTLGLRLALGRYSALRFDIGYGVLGGTRSLEDRWWLIPSYGVVIPIERIRIELGFGVGFATSSGYTDFDAFVQAPFDDDWAYQLIPAARGHAALWVEASDDVDVYFQLDGGGLIIEGNDIGLRVGPDGNRRMPSAAERTWATLTVGTTIRL